MRGLAMIVMVAVLAGCGVKWPQQGEAVPPGQVAFIQSGDLWVQTLPGGKPRRLTRAGGYSAPAWVPSGRWILVQVNGHYVIIKPDGTDRSALGGLKRVVWAPHGDQIAYLDEHGRLGVQTIGSRSGQRVLVDPGKDESIGNVTWSPDGEWIAYDLTRGRGAERSYAGLWRVPVSGGKPLEAYGRKGPFPCLQLAGWSPDGTHLLYWPGSCSASGAADGLPLMAVSVRGGTPRQLGESMLLYDDYLVPAPDGRLAVVVGGGRMSWTEKQVLVVDPQTGHRVEVSPQGMASVSPTWSPDGSQLAFVAAPDAGKIGGGDPARRALMQRRLWVAAADGTGARQVTDTTGLRDEAPRWTPDGILFCRLDQEARTSLWLMRSVGGKPIKVADMDPLESWFGYYGTVNCGALFDYHTEIVVRSQVVGQRVAVSNQASFSK